MLTVIYSFSSTGRIISKPESEDSFGIIRLNKTPPTTKSPTKPPKLGMTNPKFISMIVVVDRLPESICTRISISALEQLRPL